MCRCAEVACFQSERRALQRQMLVMTAGVLLTLIATAL